MFLEPQRNNKVFNGWIEVICGSMFSGKTEELLRRVRRVSYANLKVQIFKPAIDNRYKATSIASHDQRSVESHIVKNASTIREAVEKDTIVVVIDEAQFFDDSLPKVCSVLANEGKRVIVAGLDMDYTGKPFGVVPILLSQAEYVTKLHAICVQCGQLAQYTYRKIASSTQVVVGAGDAYEPRCRFCYERG